MNPEKGAIKQTKTSINQLRSDVSARLFKKFLNKFAKQSLSLSLSTISPFSKVCT